MRHSNKVADAPRPFAPLLRSKLEPYRELIRNLRRKGLSYRQIAAHLQQHYGVYAAISTIHSFVKVRSKHRKREQYEMLPPEHEMTITPSEDPIARLKSRPARTATAGRPFHYDGGPLEPAPQETRYGR